MQDEYLSTEHLLLAIAGEKEGDAGRILRSNGITKDDAEKVVNDMRGGTRITDQNAEEKTKSTTITICTMWLSIRNEASSGG